ncbi:hypothetical protein IAR50_004467 [Cryptococcus sp. DSM 104548]
MEASITPETFARLEPVHYHVLRHLSYLSPHKTLFLSRYSYRLTIPSLYRDVTLGFPLFASLLGGGDSAKRTTEALSHTRVLRLPPDVIFTDNDTGDDAELVNAILDGSKPTPFMPLSLLPQTPIFGGIQHLIPSATAFQNIMYLGIDAKNPKLSTVSRLFCGVMPDISVDLGASKVEGWLVNFRLGLYLHAVGSRVVSIVYGVADPEPNPKRYLYGICSDVLVSWPGAQALHIYFDPDLPSQPSETDLSDCTDMYVAALGQLGSYPHSQHRRPRNKTQAALCRKPEVIAVHVPRPYHLAVSAGMVEFLSKEEERYRDKMSLSKEDTENRDRIAFLGPRLQILAHDYPCGPTPQLDQRD